MTATAMMGRQRAAGIRWAALWSPLLEMMAVLAAIALIWPGFERVAQFGDGRDQRFAERGFRVDGLPPPVLPDVCALHARLAETLLRQRLCGLTGSISGTEPVSTVPHVLKQASAQAAHAFAMPVMEAQARLDALRLRGREGLGELRETSDEIAAVEADIQPYLDRFKLQAGSDAGPLPLQCAMRWADAALTPAASATQDESRANAVLLLAAALDGRSATPALVAQALLPSPSPALALPSCAEDGATALSGAAVLMSDTRQSLSQARKNEAMRELMRIAGWQWAGAMMLGYIMLRASRTGTTPALGVGVALLAWSAAGWAARVPWPLAGHGIFEPARIDTFLPGIPAPFVLWLAGIGTIILAFGIARRSHRPPVAQSMSSRMGYPGLVLLTGIGWLLLFDLSAHGHAVNRYLALYHQGHLWMGMLSFSVLVFLRRPLSRALGRWLSMAGQAARAIARHIRSRMLAAAFIVLAAIGLLAVFGIGLANMRQLTSELGRVWLILGAAWFFFLRAGPLVKRLAEGRAILSFGRYAWPLLLVVGVLVGAQVVTRDMGPLLIASYAGGAFVAAAIAMWWHQRGGPGGWAFLFAIVLFVAWIASVTAALFEVGPVHTVTAARLESLAAPLASTNDQLALVSWFQHAAPPQGFGLGAVPWCGYAAATQCRGIPAQVHSDYTFTAMVGVFGPYAAWGLSLGAALWLHRLIRHHGRVTRGEPRFVASADHVAYDGQALLSWISVGWVVLTLCQLAVTVAGNLAVLPLTGVTFPFVSYGMTSLLVNLSFLAMCLNVDLPPRRSAVERHV